MNFSENQYKRRLEELYRISPSVQTAGFAPDAYKPGLEGMRELDSASGRPSSRLRFIHVAGTNGKGSVCSMFAAALSAAGMKTGLYTSPHLLDFRERMKICTADGWKMISREDVWEYLDSFQNAIAGRSFFEVTTGMALWWFDREGVDIAVMETGLGGRLDSTNIITPELSVITSIGLDHCKLLGSTRAQIAAEKAGIFKAGTPALVWGHDSETDKIFERKAEEMPCPLFFADEMGIASASENADLKAECQAVNRRTVLAGLELLGIATDSGTLDHAAALTGLRGRWETLSTNPEVICDIGHNPSALEPNFKKLRGTGRPLIIVYGVMADKDYRSNISLIPDGATVIAASPDTPRALDTETLAGEISNLRSDLSVILSESVADAVGIALKKATENSEFIIFICGSTFVVSEAIQYIEK